MVGLSTARTLQELVLVLALQTRVAEGMAADVEYFGHVLLAVIESFVAARAFHCFKIKF